MKIGLVDDWKAAWRWFSVNLSVLGAATCGAWLLMPADTQAAIVEKFGLEPAWVPLFGFLSVIVGRLIAQQPKGDPPAE